MSLEKPGNEIKCFLGVGWDLEIGILAFGSSVVVRAMNTLNEIPIMKMDLSDLGSFKSHI